MGDPMNLRWLRLSREDILTERKQCIQEGKDVSALDAEFERVAAMRLETRAGQAAAGALLDKAAELPPRGDFPYREPSELNAIRAECDAPPALPAFELDDGLLADKVFGAWLGRVSGCLLGKPVEGWRRPRMWGYLMDTSRWPLDDYFSLNVPQKILAKYEVPRDAPFIENVDCMPEDDDTNYTTVGLAILGKFGADFTPADVAEFWLAEIPILHTCTAERVAYRNLCTGLAPPESAAFRNPYREWIGAQIRADFFGYACAGDPERAAEFAWRDACISHVKNGIYGEMWAAAMIASAFATDDVETIIASGLARIPRRSRLHEAVGRVRDMRGRGVGYDEVVENIHAEWDENNAHDWCHTISNAQVVAAALLWGDGDFTRSICRAVQACFDTDCNGATVGSVIGAVVGARNVPEKWRSPLNDTLLTGVSGYHRVRISRLAAETVGIIKNLRAGRNKP